MAQTYHKLRSTHILILGGSSGIGLAVAEACLSSGAHVTISSSSLPKLTSAASHLQTLYPTQSINAIQTDLSDPSTLETNLTYLFETAQSTLGTTHHVVFTAADALSLGDLTTVSAEGIRQAAHMRMVVPLLVAKIATRYLPKTYESSIVLTSGCVAEKPVKGWAVVSYFAGGLVSLGRALAVELAPVRVNVVRPGYVDTGIWGERESEEREGAVRAVGEKVLTGRMGRVEDVAEAYLWVMKDGNVTGSVAGSDGGILLV
ncbi:hypothetical protein OQA88_4773 [Cercophora sp. LCS_1]